jgi:hypothetical protein
VDKRNKSLFGKVKYIFLGAWFGKKSGSFLLENLWICDDILLPKVKIKIIYGMLYIKHQHHISILKNNYFNIATIYFNICVAFQYYISTYH